MSRNVAVVVLMVTFGFTASGSVVAAADCQSVISSEGRAANPMNYDPPKHYDMETLAKSRARAAWRQAVQSGCPGYSANLQKAKQRTDFCEGYAGGLSCTVNAVPSRS